MTHDPDELTENLAGRSCLRFVSRCAILWLLAWQTDKE